MTVTLPLHFRATGDADDPARSLQNHSAGKDSQKPFPTANRVAEGQVWKSNPAQSFLS